MIHIYRLAHWAYCNKIPLIPRLLYFINRVLFAVVLPPSAKLGRNVLLGYSGLGIVIHARCVIGSGVSIGTNVTIGGRNNLHGVPIIEDRVEIGSGAKILGPITIGQGAKIGANAVVLCDVPENCTYVGIPARAVKAPRMH